MTASLSDRRPPIDRPVPAAGTRLGWGYRRTPSHVHAGVDLGARPGTPVMAPEAGVVSEVITRDVPPWRGYAPCVLLAGASGVWHLLAHLGPTIAVLQGDAVALGDALGAVGALRHVHWEVRTRDRARYGRGERPSDITIDPRAWLAGAHAPSAEVMTRPFVVTPPPHRGR